jgi:hypothetical protein
MTKAIEYVKELNSS